MELRIASRPNSRPSSGQSSPVRPSTGHGTPSRPMSGSPPLAVSNSMVLDLNIGRMLTTDDFDDGRYESDLWDTIVLEKEKEK